MKYADHHGFPIITFINTPGTFADLRSEELGQVSQQLTSFPRKYSFKVWQKHSS